MWGAIFIGWALPQQVRDYIREVSQTSVVRKNFRIEYTLVEDGDGVKVQVTTEVEVYNYMPAPSDIGQPNPSICTTIQTNQKPNVNGRSTASSTRWTQPNLRKRSWLNGTQHVITWKLKPMRLPPQDVEDPRATPACWVRWTFVERMPVPYTDFHAVSSPTINIAVTANFPRDIEFTCDGPNTHAEGSNHWSYERLYMPGQSIRVRWSRIPGQQQADAPRVLP